MGLKKPEECLHIMLGRLTPEEKSKTVPHEDTVLRPVMSCNDCGAVLYYIAPKRKG
jgi:hypothetical protein